MSDNEILEVEAEQLEPLGNEEEFAALVERLVLDEAPRVFALVEEVGERADAGIVAWGMALRDRAELVAVGGGMRGSFSSAESARELFGLTRELRLVWLPEA
ncbi:MULTISPECIES: hypothetical protein [unclassified Actinopolyspora]|uniref:hypothetical protein n=1 Tax=unclassified Actinopolyspora TaxID=2639451 RepID=UPI0013F645EF|nr:MULTISPECIES: hypothetical protein [unclassified Actinopolyspora]NHD16926.1 hypothetical protein [Actinopolyspora sp. BKK2]NHE76078.1 hypothetical protein [Actinopolyspora sp. BKK1]